MKCVHIPRMSLTHYNDVCFLPETKLWNTKYMDHYLHVQGLQHSVTFIRIVNEQLR